MKPSKNLLIVFLALVSVIATGVAWQQYWKAAQLRAMAAGVEDSADLRRRLAAAEKHNRELDSLLAARSASGSGAESGADAAGGATARDANQNRGRGGPRSDFAAMFDRPEMQRLRALQQKVALDGRYGALFKSLNLSSDQLGKFKALLAEKESTMMDTMMAAREQGIDPRTDPQGFRNLVATAQAAIDNEIKTVLGSEDFAQYEQYQKTQPQRAVVDQLQQSLSYTSEPLTTAQAAQMVQILAATAPQTTGQSATPSPDGGAGGGPPGFPGGFSGGAFGGGAVITPAAVAQAQTVLTPTQQQALVQLQQVQAAQQQVQQLMRDNGIGGPPGGGGAGGG